MQHIHHHGVMRMRSMAMPASRMMTGGGTRVGVSTRC